jgi:hypothetical protein
MSTVYLRSQVVLVAALDDEEKDIHFRREDATLSTINHEFAAESSDHLVMAASETGFDLAMGKVATGAFLYIETDKDLNLKFDGGAETIPIKPTGAGVKGKLLLMSSFTTAPQLDNTTSELANISYIIAGALS